MREQCGIIHTPQFSLFTYYIRRGLMVLAEPLVLSPIQLIDGETRGWGVVRFADD